MEESILTFHILLFQGDRVLLVKHGEGAGHLTGVWGIPGGRPIDNETPKETAVREFSEETGLKVENEDLQDFPDNQYTADVQRKDGVSRRYTMKIFLCDTSTGELKSSTETEPEWIKFSEVSKYNLFPNGQKAVETAYHFLYHAKV